MVRDDFIEEYIEHYFSYDKYDFLENQECHYFTMLLQNVFLG